MNREALREEITEFVCANNHKEDCGYKNGKCTCSAFVCIENLAEQYAIEAVKRVVLEKVETFGGENNFDFECIGRNKTIDDYEAVKQKVIEELRR